VSLQFVPLWTSVLRSRKVADLPEVVQLTWVKLLLIAQEYDYRFGSLPCMDDIAYQLHMGIDELTRRIVTLSRDRFLEERDGVLFIHDWEEWRYRSDPTGVLRKRAQRERDRLKQQGVTSNAVCETGQDVTVTRDSHVTSQMSQMSPNNSNSNYNNTPPLPPRDGGSACVRETSSSEGHANPESFPVARPSWSPDERRGLDRATDRWGACNGDVVIGDLLRDYPARLVGEACDRHFGQVKASLHPGRLRGLCRTMFESGRWEEEERSPAIVPMVAEKSDAEIRAMTEDLKRQHEAYYARFDREREARRAQA